MLSVPSEGPVGPGIRLPCRRAAEGPETPVAGTRLRMGHDPPAPPRTPWDAHASADGARTVLSPASSSAVRG